MNDIKLRSVLIFCCITTLSIHALTRSVASQSLKDSFLGVSPLDENYYKGLLSSSAIKCKDGSKKFNKSQFNDDFCDCPDGSDEPGTSACPNGKFYCKNAGHIPTIIYSSRVNDGICDCCDGSDEYDGKNQCMNTCWEAGKAAREKLRKKIETYKDGITIRKKEIEQAKSAIMKDERELLKLKDDEKVLKPLVEKLRERKEQIERAEDEERQQKEKEEKERQKEVQESEGKTANVEPVRTDVHDNSGEREQVQKGQDLEEDHHESVHEPEPFDHSINQGLPNEEVGGVDAGANQNSQHNAEDPTFDGAAVDTGIQDNSAAEDSESLSREELGRLVASRWTGDKSEHHKDEIDASPNRDHQDLDETQSDINEEEDNGYVSEDGEHKYDDDDDNGSSDDSYDHTDDLGSEDQYNPSSPPNLESDDELDLADVSTTSSSSWLEKMQKTVKNIFQAVNLFQKPVNVSDAAHIRKEYEEANAKLSKMQSKISKLSQKLGHDFGPEKEFYSFYGQCFESKQNKYVYKVCPFKQATQEEGYSTTRLGNWEKFEDSYRTMQFLNGDKCWNGPDRSLKVKLRCGLKNELADVDEPSRCEYLALLSTPALCVESKLKELEMKLDALNNEEPKAGQEHDEL